MHDQEKTTRKRLVILLDLIETHGGPYKTKMYEFKR